MKKRKLMITVLVRVKLDICMHRFKLKNSHYKPMENLSCHSNESTRPTTITNISTIPLMASEEIFFCLFLFCFFYCCFFCFFFWKFSLSVCCHGNELNSGHGTFTVYQPNSHEALPVNLSDNNGTFTIYKSQYTSQPVMGHSQYTSQTVIDHS